MAVFNYWRFLLVLYVVPMSSSLCLAFIANKALSRIETILLLTLLLLFGKRLSLWDLGACTEERTVMVDFNAVGNSGLENRALGMNTLLLSESQLQRLLLILL